MSRTKAVQAYMNRVADLGCALCRRLYGVVTPPHLHHPRTGTGAGRKASDLDVLPLCPEHHQGNTGIHGMGRKAFEREYGVTELELMEETKQLAGCPA